MKQRYKLPHSGVRGLSYDLAYRGIDIGTIDITDLYSTDAQIQHYDLIPLADDLSFFPACHTILLFRADFAERARGSPSRCQRSRDESSNPR